MLVRKIWLIDVLRATGNLLLTSAARKVVAEHKMAEELSS
jgi:hypothetical protein